MRLDLRSRVIMFFTLPGFEQEHVEVQKIGSDVLAITGQRPLDDGHRWIRFEKFIRFRAICNLGEYRAGFGKNNFIITIPKITGPLHHNHDEEATTKQLPAGNPASAEEQKPVVRVDSDGDDDEMRIVQPGVEELVATDPPATNITAAIASTLRSHLKFSSCQRRRLQKRITSLLKQKKGALFLPPLLPTTREKSPLKKIFRLRARSKNQPPIIE
ncbi:unnamed protein product [Linum trigynum]|uniref:SHSP domain-containing protein n=1 Tax=Linum trigynum TaxID=586398 RepID=A0AAV2F1Q1_9ROSI